MAESTELTVIERAAIAARRRRERNRAGRGKNAGGVRIAKLIRFGGLAKSRLRAALLHFGGISRWARSPGAALLRSFFGPEVTLCCIP